MKALEARQERSKFIALTQPLGEPQPARLGAIPARLLGNDTMEEALLENRIGPSAMQLWRWLCRVRDPKTGETRLRVEDARHWPGWEVLPLGTLKRAMRALLRAGLVRGLGWVREARGYRYRRLVLGHPRWHFSGELCAVPHATKRWAMEANGHGGPRANSGGARPGAGRPRKTISKALPGISKASRGNHQDAPALRSLLRERNDVLPKGRTYPADAGEDLSEPRPKPSARKPKRKPGILGDVGDVFSESAPALIAAELPPETPLELPAESMLGPDEAIVSAPMLEGSSEIRARGPLAIESLSLPEVSTAEMLRVPAPPLLSPDESEGRNAYLVASWFAHGIGKYYGKKYWPFLKGFIGKSPHYRLLVAASKAFIAHGIAPAAWIAWSIDVWRTNKPDSQPPVAWMFSVTRIEKSAGWFFGEGASSLGNEVVHTPAGRALAFLRNQMMRELCARSVQSKGDVSLVVARHLPPEVFEELQARARQEVAATLAALRSDILLGKWVW